MRRYKENTQILLRDQNNFIIPTSNLKVEILSDPSNSFYSTDSNNINIPTGSFIYQDKKRGDLLSNGAYSYYFENNKLVRTIDEMEPLENFAERKIFRNIFHANIIQTPLPAINYYLTLLSENIDMRTDQIYHVNNERYYVKNLNLFRNPFNETDGSGTIEITSQLLTNDKKF